MPIDLQPAADQLAALVRNVRDEQLAGDREVHGTGDGTLGVGGGHRGRPHRQSVEEVAGPVDRVEVPLDAAGTGVVGALLADDGVVGAGGEQAVDDHALGGAVVAGHDVGERRLRRRPDRAAQVAAFGIGAPVW